MIQFCCVHCQTILDEEKNAFLCKKCHTVYPIKDDIPYFSQGDYYFGDIPEDKMDELIVQSEEYGWKEAYHDYLRTLDSSAYKLACDESRADWRFLFPLSKKSAVLDMGSGFGGISFSLAQRCGTVVSMDCSLKRLKFGRIRVKQENVRNIVSICGGDTLKLPFPDNSFDLVVLNGVLEWMGIFHNELKPQEVQLIQLKEVLRVLKNKGSVYIGIENRLSYSNFLGAKDHSGLRFTALMSRKFADIYCKIRIGRSYRTYTYTLGGYRRLLKKAGFSSADVYATIPTYRDVFFLINVNDRKSMSYFFRYLLSTYSTRRKIISVFSRILLKIGLFRFFIPEYGIAAKR